MSNDHGDDQVARSWAMRPADDDDRPFLDQLYLTTRWEEVLAWGLPPQAAQLFLKAQASTQRRAYALQFPSAEHRVLLMAGCPVGRLIVSDEPEGQRIVDLAVMPAVRRQGLASWAIRDVLDRARHRRRPVHLHASVDNPARSLYERLGFRATTAASETGLVSMICDAGASDR